MKLSELIKFNNIKLCADNPNKTFQVYIDDLTNKYFFVINDNVYISDSYNFECNNLTNCKYCIYSSNLTNCIGCNSCTNSSNLINCDLVDDDNDKKNFINESKLTEFCFIDAIMWKIEQNKDIETAKGWYIYHIVNNDKKVLLDKSHTSNYNCYNCENCILCLNCYNCISCLRCVGCVNCNFCQYSAFCFNSSVLNDCKLLQCEHNKKGVKNKSALNDNDNTNHTQ